MYQPLLKRPGKIAFGGVVSDSGRIRLSYPYFLYEERIETVVPRSGIVRRTSVLFARKVFDGASERCVANVRRVFYSTDCHKARYLLVVSSDGPTTVDVVGLRKD